MDLPSHPGPGWLDRWIEDNTERLVAVRRRLHSRPELGYEEHATTAMLGARLAELGLEPKILPGGTGLFCDIGAGPCVVALRADIDALPLTDTKHVPYRSTVPGVCHACGHDAHTAAVL